MYRIKIQKVDPIKTMKRRVKRNAMSKIKRKNPFLYILIKIFKSI